MADIRLLITDIDGVWTDCTVYVDSDGRETCRYSKRDGVLLPYMREAGIEVVALTSEQRNGTHIRRAADLGVEIAFCLPDEKLLRVTEIAQSCGLTLAQVAYIGDDLPDLPVLRAVAVPFAPSRSPALGAAPRNTRVVSKGGKGALRDVCAQLLALADVNVMEWPPKRRTA